MVERKNREFRKVSVRHASRKDGAGTQPANPDRPNSTRPDEKHAGQPESLGKENQHFVDPVPSYAGFGVRIREAFNRVRGVPVEVDLSPYRENVAAIHAFRDKRRLDRVGDGDLRRMYQGLRGRIATERAHAQTRGRRRRKLAASVTPGLEAGRDFDRVVASAERGSRRRGVPQNPTAIIEAFALVFEASRRGLGLVPHDVQLVAGLVMSGSRIAELPTGEGKTLAAVFPAAVAALSGRGVHVLTFNDYLARRDADWMGPAYRLLGLSVGAVQEGLSPALKREAYARDVTYATAKEAGFDFLRDQLAYEKSERVHRPFSLAIIDEADSTLVDEARIPLVISGVAGRLDHDAARLAALAGSLAPGRDFETDEAKTSVSLTDAGLERVERSLGCENLYAAENEALLAAVHCALHAEVLLHRDTDYIVRDGRVEIVDEFTGRVMDKRHWPDGLQAAVEAKEDVFRKSQGRILGTITLQHFFRLYPALCGMTATAAPSAAEFKEFFGLSVAVVPPHRPCVRIDHPDRVFTHEEAKTRALVREIAEVNVAGRPVLVGTLTVKESEDLAAVLRGDGIPCEVLNAKNDELEAGIIAAAGRPGAVTISTNMAGRGTDIKLGGPGEEERDRVVSLGGLYVIGTNRHESLRVDRQLRGRAGRQGDPGSSRFFISFDDDIFDRYGLRRTLVSRYWVKPQGDALDDPAIRREIVHAQKTIEGQNFGIRRSLWAFSIMIETQRRIVEGWRREALEGREPDWPGPADGEAGAWGEEDGLANSAGGEAVGGPGGESTAESEPRAAAASGSSERLSALRESETAMASGWDPATLASRGRERFGREIFDDLVRRVRLSHIDRAWADHLARLADIREGIHLVSLGGREPADEFMKAATDAFDAVEDGIAAEAQAHLASLVAREGPVDLDAEGLKGPSSTWTYLVNEDQFGWGMGLIKGKNIGLAAGAAALYGPLFVFTLLLGRRRRKKARKEKATSG